MAGTVDPLATTVADDPLPERAAALVALLRANAARTEDERRLPEANVQALRDAGLFKLAVPERFGGHQTDLRTFVRVSAELGRGCGSTAWTTTLINIAGWLISLLPEQAQHDVYGADPDARACGVLAPSATSRAVATGHVITGRWEFASGCLHSQWTLLGMPIVDDAGDQVDQGLALVPMTELSIEDTWYVAGLRGTGSNTLVAEDVFVPSHRIVSMTKAMQGEYATEHTEEALYRSAFAPASSLVLAGPQVGLARGGLELVRASLARGKGISYTYYDDARRAPTTQLQLAEAAQLIDTAELHMLRAADDVDSWAASGEYMPTLNRARVRMDTGYAARRSREALDLLLNVHGAAGFADASPLQRSWRDQETCSRHAVVNPAITTEIYGRALLGLEDQVTPLL